MSNRVQRSMSAGLAAAWIGMSMVGVTGAAFGSTAGATKPAAKDATPGAAKPAAKDATPGATKPAATDATPGAAKSKPATAKAATAARKLASGKLGDFESGSLDPGKAGVGWAKFAFAQGAKQPAADVKIVDGGKGGKKALRFEGTIPDGAQYAFIGAGCGFGKQDDKEAIVDISAYKGIRFDVRGDENPYRLALISDAVKDYNFHGKNFVAEKAWTTVTVPFTEIKQTEGWGTALPFTGKDIKAVSFATTFQFTGPAWFEIDNVELYK
jgi:hypothetical protein